MTLEEIKNAVDNGETVRWSNESYTVIKDDKGQYLIKHDNGHCIGLTWTDGVTLNGKEEEFYRPENSTTENNKLIAEFMGNTTIRINVPFEYDLNEELPTSGNICKTVIDAMEEVQTEIDEGVVNGCDLCMEVTEYHTSWEWLMTVVEKIESITHSTALTGFYVKPIGVSCEIEPSSGHHKEAFRLFVQRETKLEATYEVVVEFIKWYKNQEVRLFSICGYYVDDKAEFENYLVKENDEVGDDDENIFFYGLSEKDIQLAIESKEPVSGEFVITSYKAAN